MRFGRLTQIEAIVKNGKTHWVCLCDCGSVKVVRQDHLIRGEVVSCGCYQKEIAGDINKSHGMKNTRIYRIWRNMRSRCENNRLPQYADWGGRGIAVCDEWRDFEGFYVWAMGNGYNDTLSIDRIDNDRGYYPENCRWVTAREQALNRRSNTYITHNGVTKHISEWDKDIGSKKSGRVRARLNAGWSVEKAVTTPVKHSGRHRYSEDADVK